LSFKCTHLLSSLPDRLEQLELKKYEIPTPVACLPRLYGVGLSQVVQASYFRYSCVQLDHKSTIPTMTRVFCTLSVDGALRFWSNHDCATVRFFVYFVFEIKIRVYVCSKYSSIVTHTHIHTNNNNIYYYIDGLG